MALLNPYFSGGYVRGGWLTSHEDRFLLVSMIQKKARTSMTQWGCSSQSSRTFPLLIFHQDDNKITHQHRFSAACILTACTQCLQRSPLGASLREVGENLATFRCFLHKNRPNSQWQCQPTYPLFPPEIAGLMMKTHWFPLIKNLIKSLFLWVGGGVL